MTSWAAAFIPIEVENKKAAMADTWGHLFPEDKLHVGTIRVSDTPYDGRCVLHEEVDIPGSPWWYSALHDFVDELVGIEPGGVYDVGITVEVVHTEKWNECLEEMEKFETIKIKEVNITTMIEPLER